MRAAMLLLLGAAVVASGVFVAARLPGGGGDDPAVATTPAPDRAATTAPAPPSTTRPAEAGAEPEPAYLELRELALAAAGDLPPPPPEHRDVAGVVVDVPAEGGHATIVALADGTTSLYVSTGGGIIGAGERPAVAEASVRLLTVAQDHVAAFGQAGDASLPTAGRVRIHLLTPEGRRVADLAEAVFWLEEEGELSPVAIAVQDVITAMRTSDG